MSPSFKHAITCTLFAVALCAGAQSAHAASRYTFTFLNDGSYGPVQPGVSTIPGMKSVNDTNSKGVVVGSVEKISYQAIGWDSWGNPTMIPVSSSHAAVWNNGVITDIGGFPTSYWSDEYASEARSINDLGQIVGWSESPNSFDGIAHGALWENNQAIDLNIYLPTSVASAGWVLMFAQDIDNSGQITGIAMNVQNYDGSLFMLTPVPEPETYALMLGGLGLVGFMARRRKAA